MAIWIASCKNCNRLLKNWGVEGKGMENFFLPAKPELPTEGTNLKCSGCGVEATYHAFNLVYHEESVANARNVTNKSEI
jgi:hypothetical protein